MMNAYKYLIIGGGMTADSAVRGIRQVDSSGSIGLVSQENDPPYNRPPLSKGLWQGRPIERIMRRTALLGLDLHLGCKIVRLDPAAKVVVDNSGNEYGYEKLLLATGGSPIHPPTFCNKVIFYRTLNDYKNLRALTAQGQDFAILGGGFIGSEITAALVNQKKNVTMLFPEAGICARIFPSDSSLFLSDYYRQKGVQVLTPRLVSAVEERGEKLVVRTNQQEELIFDGVIAGLGIRPEVELAKQAGLDVENGIVVNSQLQTSNPDIYAAGDVANFFNSSLNRRLRVEHEENANTSGMLAGKNMAGSSETYDYLPYFYSDLFELGYEGVGELDPSLEVIEDWVEIHKKGAAFYTREGRVRGVLLWKIQGKMDQARKLIQEPGPFTKSDLVGMFTR
jgi:3-phenylpropionate/trans-cinnamate dioxygenase ferredoxin reductase component